MKRLLALAAVVLLLGIAVACADTAEAPPTRSPTRSGTPAATLTPTVAIPFPTGPTEATVTDVIDGDTIEVEIGSDSFRLRYIGIDTPETVDPNRPDGCYGEEASQHNKELVLGKIVGLEPDVSNTDEFGRLLRYVWVGNEMVNATLVRDGYAYASTYPPDVKHQDELLKLQTEAREASRGLWGDVCANATPLVVPTQTPPPASGSEVCDYSGTTQAIIKGNISSSGEKIYHVPGQEHYDDTVVTESKGERWFCTEGDALDAGWRRARA